MIMNSEMSDTDRILQSWLICIGQTGRSMSRYPNSMDERENTVTPRRREGI
jgi:hypothetical protein